MSEEKVVVLNSKHPIPVRALWTLLRSIDVELDKDGFPVKGTEHDVRAFRCVKHWLGEYEAKNGLPSLSAGVEYEELHPDHAKFLVCPFCSSNDGCFVDYDEGPLAYCTVHEVKWSIPPNLLSTPSFFPPPGVIGEYTKVDGVDILARQEDWSPPVSLSVREPDEQEPLVPSDRSARDRLTQLGKDAFLLLLMPVFLAAEFLSGLRETVSDWLEEFKDRRGRHLAGRDTRSME